jgi:hypothetical protein
VTNRPAIHERFDLAPPPVGSTWWEDDRASWTRGADHWLPNNAAAVAKSAPTGPLFPHVPFQSGEKPAP